MEKQDREILKQWQPAAGDGSMKTMNLPEPIVTGLIDAQITAAKCSACDESLDMPKEVGSRDDQELKLERAFAKHIENRHRRKVV
jgi:hypothetical protein